MMNAWLKDRTIAHAQLANGATVAQMWSTDSADRQSSLQRGYIATLKRTGEFIKGSLQTMVSCSEMEYLSRITERARTGR